MSKPPVGIKTKDNPKIKTFCYKSDCGPIVETGFHLEKYQICTKCKEEVSEVLKDRVDFNYKTNHPTPEPEEPEYDDDQGIFFPFNP